MKSTAHRSSSLATMRGAAGALASSGAPASKYHAVRCEIEHKGKIVKCASRAEAKRFGELILLERAGEIGGLQFHPAYALDAYMPCGSGRRSIGKYVADAQYFDVRAGCTITEECKGHPTDVWKLKRKLFEANYPLATLRIVKAGKGRA